MENKKERCDNCGERTHNLIYDCVYEKSFCDRCNNVKTPHPDILVEKAFKKLWKKLKSW